MNLSNSIKQVVFNEALGKKSRHAPIAGRRYEAVPKHSLIRTTGYEAPEWLLQAETKNEKVWIDDDGEVHWMEGEWLNGKWGGGFWHGGTWHKGQWTDGVWFDGTWNGGDWHRGEWVKGTWNEGFWWYGTW